MSSTLCSKEDRARVSQTAQQSPITRVSSPTQRTDVEQENIAKCLQHFTKAVNVANENVTAFNNLSIAHNDLTIAYQDVCRQHHELRNLYSQLGRRCQELEQHEAATKARDQAASKARDEIIATLLSNVIGSANAALNRVQGTDEYGDHDEAHWPSEKI